MLQLLGLAQRAAALRVHHLFRKRSLHSVQRSGQIRHPGHLSRRGVVTTAAASAKNTPKHVSPAFREDVVRILEQAENSVDAWTTAFTDFYNPIITGEALAALRQSTVCAIAWGGYAQAERTRIAFIREEIKEAIGDAVEQVGGVAALRVKGNFMFDAATHRDFLGACLGTGIERSKVGDILLDGERGAQILIVPELAEFICMHLTSVRTVPVEVQEVPLSELKVPEARTKVLKTVEASLRLDAVASAGFGISRSKMVDLIKSGDVRVNWQPAKASADVAQGDVISCSGKGRVEVRDVSITKKGRHALELHRLL